MQRKRVLCFGDSLTWGFDPESRERFPEESRWPVVLQQELGDSFQVIEEGQCGRTIATEDPAEGENSGRTEEEGEPAAAREVTLQSVTAANRMSMLVSRYGCIVTACPDCLELMTRYGLEGVRVQDIFELLDGNC